MSDNYGWCETHGYIDSDWICPKCYEEENEEIIKIDPRQLTGKWQLVREYTGMKDKNGKEIFVGDKVKKTWGYWAETGWEVKKHVITKYVNKNKIEYHLDNLHNIWEGKEVEVIE